MKNISIVDWTFPMKEGGFVEIQTDNINPNISGFHWRSHGRGVNIYFVEGQSKFDLEKQIRLAMNR